MYLKKNIYKKKNLMSSFHMMTSKVDPKPDWIGTLKGIDSTNQR